MVVSLFSARMILRVKAAQFALLGTMGGHGSPEPFTTPAIAVSRRKLPLPICHQYRTMFVVILLLCLPKEEALSQRKTVQYPAVSKSHQGHHGFLIDQR